LAEEIQVARAAAAAALGAEGVSRLGVGQFAEAATYGAGEKVSGVVVGDDEVRVHVVLDYPLPGPIPVISEGVSERVGSLVGGRRVMVVVEDLEIGEYEGL
jgi:hypothetical protein